MNSIEKAFAHINENGYNVSYVEFDRNLRWVYYKEDGSAPTFDLDIDFDILEDAADYAYDIEQFYFKA